ncbi:MAG: HAD-IA family hydrolase [Hyphomonas sp.]|uniref:HAD-IA family hydrolase n=1 Tax=Hyphomonas sp. TaxID=87 RepID=UPI001814801D|nr:HAD-IA family hydrolase [Hyphomonas sp.]MBU3921867.1 HAD-IA family hydrolase [Alphaproteobacteria bacterium]MBA3067689.1 HAD-IA family hydrolase [Hyphomonas sp.]MBU4062224.1 HAD-IA family hydrolase [Alphaproteobacteria bacterium]MBU4165659.1 HAD-IA family hydrolase [Alphaproteobacteria bacterium]MBU4567400.1 HAD-IA family hydrolase [Alphaproteobacteria bacterium]
MNDGQIRGFEGWTILFDLDGTLVDTAPDLLGALNHVLTGMDLAPVRLDAVAEMIGHGARAMIETGLKTQGAVLTAAEMDAAFERFVVHYVDHIADCSRPFEGAVEALATLRDAGARLTVCTNKRQDLSERLIGALALDSYFDVIFGADRATQRKPHADHVFETLAAAGGAPERALFVGDSRTDERAARNAGLPFVFVTFGYEAETAEAIGADVTISHYAQLVSALSDLRDQAVASPRGR